MGRQTVKHWEAEFKGHRIRVENELFAERLIIDGTVQDARRGAATRRALCGEITDGSGAAKPVLAELSEGTDEGVACRIFVSGQCVYSSANARPA
jgi:hypothetical protein